MDTVYRLSTRAKIGGKQYRRGDYVEMDAESARHLVRGNVLTYARDQEGARVLIQKESTGFHQSSESPQVSHETQEAVNAPVKRRRGRPPKSQKQKDLKNVI